MFINVENQATGQSQRVDAVAATARVRQLKDSIAQQTAGTDLFDASRDDLLYEQKLALGDDEPVEASRLIAAREVKLVPHVALEERAPNHHEWFEADMHLVLREDDVLQDDRTLEDYDIKPGETVYVVPVGKGAPSPAPSPSQLPLAADSDRTSSPAIQVLVPNYAATITLPIAGVEKYGDLKRRAWEIVLAEENDSLQRQQQLPTTAAAMQPQLQQQQQQSLRATSGRGPSSTVSTAGSTFSGESDTEQGFLPSDREIDALNIEQLRALCKAMKRDLAQMRQIYALSPTSTRTPADVLEANQGSSASVFLEKPAPPAVPTLGVGDPLPQQQDASRA